MRSCRVPRSAHPGGGRGKVGRRSLGGEGHRAAVADEVDFTAHRPAHDRFPPQVPGRAQGIPSDGSDHGDCRDLQ
eukprot:8026438-Alexandrium_andersonii.AAC.1